MSQRTIGLPRAKSIVAAHIERGSVEVGSPYKWVYTPPARYSPLLAAALETLAASSDPAGTMATQALGLTELSYGAGVTLAQVVAAIRAAGGVG